MRVHMYKNHGITEEGKDLEKKEEKDLATSNSLACPEEVGEKLVTKYEEGSSPLVQDPAPPQVEVALLGKIEFHYPTFTWAQLVQQGMVGEDASFLPPAMLEEGSELVMEDVEDKMMVEERIFV